MVIFDYIYFRIAKFYFKKDGSSAQRAIAIVSIIQTLLFGVVLFLCHRYLIEISILNTSAKYVGILIGGAILLFNYRRYRNKYLVFREKWFEKENSKSYKVKGYLVVIAILFPFILLLLMTKNPFFDKLF